MKKQVIKFNLLDILLDISLILLIFMHTISKMNNHNFIILSLLGGNIMDDFRFLEDNSLWIIVIIIFLLLLFGNGGCGCGGFNFDCLGNLFGGCGNNSCLWIIIIILVIWFLSKCSCGSIFRNDIQ